MHSQDERQRLSYRGANFGSRARAFLVKGLAIAASVALLLGAIAVSILVFALVLTALLVIAVYLWWKTRDLRKRMRARQENTDVIEGEVVRRPESDTSHRT